jgi:hypothetical protein
MANEEESAAIRKLESSASRAQKRVLESADEARDIVKEACEVAMRELTKSAQADNRNLSGSYHWDKNGGNGGTTPYRVKLLEDRIEITNSKIEAMQSASQKYQAVISPEEIKDIQEEIHNATSALLALSTNYESFKGERVRQLDTLKDDYHGRVVELKSEIQRVREESKTENLKIINESRDDRIRNSWLWITLMAGFVVTILSTFYFDIVR